MGTFDYRIFKETEHSIIDSDGLKSVEEEVYIIRQVGYDEEGKPINYTKPYWPIGNTANELHDNIAQMLEAWSKPILTKEDFK